MQTSISGQKYSPHERVVRTVLLRDGRGKGQIIIRSGDLLDLKALNRLVERDLLPLRQAEIVTMTRAGALVPIELAPAFFLLPTIIDESVSIYENCQYEIFNTNGTERQEVNLMQLREALRQANYRVRAIKCTVPAERLYRRAENANTDLELIFNSIRNFTTLRIKQRLEETLEIPPLPQTAQRIIALRTNPNATVEDLAEIVESDASLAAQVVSWASSPYYAAPGRVSSVQDAILRVLGFDLVSNLAVGMAMGNTIALPKDCPDGFTPYWIQSVYCSTAVEAILKLMPAGKRPSPGMACLAALLHNFGYLVLAHIFPPHFSSICRHVEANPNISHVAIDHHLLGVTREQISAWLMQLWGMPAEVCTALRFQHEPEYDSEHSAYAHIIFIAMRVLREHGIGDSPPEEIPLALYDRYDLDPDRVMAAVEEVVASAEEIKKIAATFKA
jgi:HD-like signal output (HDOD) protein/prolyl-tRNA editing enzyme YbaK/EbsC (Cys-tRNA(Pro) deacylase)